MLIGTATAGMMSTVPASAQIANKMFNGDQRSYIAETQSSKQDYHLSQQRTDALLAPATVANNQMQAPTSIKIEVHATPGMDEYALAELIEHKLRDATRQSDYRRRHQMFDGHKL